MAPTTQKAAVAWLGRLPLRADHNVMIITAVAPPIVVIDVDKGKELHASRMADARRLVDEAVLNHAACCVLIVRHQPAATT